MTAGCAEPWLLGVLWGEQPCLVWFSLGAEGVAEGEQSTLCLVGAGICPALLTGHRMGCIPMSITHPPCQHPTRGQGGSLTSAEPMGTFLLISQNLLPPSPHPADPWRDTRVSVEHACFPPG